MKILNYGCSIDQSYHCGKKANVLSAYEPESYAKCDRHGAVLAKQAFENYIQNRENGADIDRPSSGVPQGDGSYSWETPGAQNSKLRYTEGPRGTAWMMQKDRSYVFRLEREGRLDSVEPRLAMEVSGLYAQIMAQRNAKQEAEKKAQEQAEQERETENQSKLAQAHAEKEQEQQKQIDELRAQLEEQRASFEVQMADMRSQLSLPVDLLPPPPPLQLESAPSIPVSRFQRQKKDESMQGSFEENLTAIKKTHPAAYGVLLAKSKKDFSETAARLALRAMVEARHWREKNPSASIMAPNEMKRLAGSIIAKKDKPLTEEEMAYYPSALSAAVIPNFSKEHTGLILDGLQLGAGLAAYCGVSYVGGGFLVAEGISFLRNHVFDGLYPEQTLEQQNKQFRESVLAAAAYYNQTSADFSALFGNIANQEKLDVDLDQDINEVIKTLPEESRELIKSMNTAMFKDNGEAYQTQEIQKIQRKQFEKRRKALEEIQKLPKRKAQLQQFEWQQNEIQGAIVVGTFLIGRVFGKPELAAKCNKTAQALNSIYKACFQYQMKNIGFLAMSGGVVGGISVLADVLMGTSNHDQLTAHFAEIKQLLDYMYVNIMSGIEQLSKNQERIYRKLEELLEQGRNITANIQFIQTQIKMLYQLILDANYQRYHDRLDLAFQNILSAIEGDFFSLKRHAKDVNLIHQHGVRISRNPLMTSAPSEEKQTMLMKIEQSPQLYWHFQRLFIILQMHDIRLPRNDFSTNVPNPFEWMKALQMFMTVLYLNFDSELLNYSFIQRHLHEFWQAGVELKEFISAASDKATIQKIVVKYHEISQVLLMTIDAELERIKQSKNLGAVKEALATQTGREMLKTSCQEAFLEFSLIASALKISLQLNIMRQKNILNFGDFKDDCEVVLGADTGVFEVKTVFTLMEENPSQVEFVEALRKAFNETMNQLNNIAEMIDSRKSLAFIDHALLGIESIVEAKSLDVELQRPLLMPAVPYTDVENLRLNIRQNEIEKLDFSGFRTDCSSQHSFDVMSCECCLLSDGRLAVLRNHIVEIWNIKQEKCVDHFDVGENASCMVALPEGRLAICGYHKKSGSGISDCVVGIWNIADGGCFKMITGFDRIIQMLALSLDKKTFILVAKNYFSNYDFTSGKIQLPPGEPLNCDVVGQGVYWMWYDELNGRAKSIPKCKQYDNIPTKVTTFFDNKLCYTSFHNPDPVKGTPVQHVFMLDMSTGKPVDSAQFSIKDFEWITCQTNMNNQLVTGAINGEIKLWKSLSLKRSFVSLPKYDQAVSFLVPLNQYQLIAGYIDGTIKVFDMPTEKCTATIKPHDQCVTYLSPVFAEKVLCVFSAGKVEIINLPNLTAEDLQSIALELKSNTSVKDISWADLNVDPEVRSKMDGIIARKKLEASNQALRTGWLCDN